MDELVDIVDQNDHIIRQSMKSLAHSELLIHRTVHGILLNNNSQIFLVKRALTKEKGPGLFDASIGGHVLAGETYDDAIVREGSEELGIENGKYTFVCKHFLDHPRMKHMCSVYFIKYEGIITLDKREFDSGIWMSFEEIMKLPKEAFTPDYLISLENMQKYL